MANSFFLRFFFLPLFFNYLQFNICCRENRCPRPRCGTSWTTTSRWRPTPPSCGPCWSSCWVVCPWPGGPRHTRTHSWRRVGVQPVPPQRIYRVATHFAAIPNCAIWSENGLTSKKLGESVVFVQFVVDFQQGFAVFLIFDLLGLSESERSLRTPRRGGGDDGQSTLLRF